MKNEQLREINISPSDRIVHLHIPKTAGTTFNTILESLAWGFDRCSDWHLLNLVDVELKKVRQFHFFIGHFTYSLFSEIIFPEGFIGLTFLREPISRTNSYFRFIYQQFKQGELYEHYTKLQADEVKETLLRDLSVAVLKDGEPPDDLGAFLEFLKSNNYKIAGNLVDLQTKVMGTTYYSIKRKLANFKDFLMNLFNLYDNKIDFSPILYKELALNIEPDKQELKNLTFIDLNRAKKRLTELAFFGITERFQDSLFLFSYIFGCRPILNKLHLNTTLSSDHSSPLNPKVVALLQQQLSCDIQLYKFGKHIFDQRFTNMTKILLERYGKKEHALLKRPLPTELMMELLEQHYINRRDQRLQLIAGTTSSSEFDYSPAMYTEGPFGWYPLEVSAIHGDYRWSGPSLQSGFDLPCPSGKNIQVSFCLLGALQVDIINELSLTINDCSINIKYTIDELGRFIFSGYIPSQAVYGLFLRIIFSVPVTVTPNSLDHNSKDYRSLGIALSWVKLQAIT